MNRTLAFAQYHVKFGEYQLNSESSRSLIEQAPPVDLLVLPELAFTGYDFPDAAHLAAVAEPFADGPTGRLLSECAATRNMVIIAGYPEKAADGHYYNSAMIALPDGAMHNYRKVHLFNRENDFFTPGDAPPRVIDTPAGRIGTMICFDWFFPEVARILAVQGAQIIAHPSNLVLPHCQRAMYARSVENHVYTVTANRIGTETQSGRTITFTGGSQVLSPTGECLASAGTDETALLTARVDLSAADAKQINPHNHLMHDRRVDLYSDLLTPAKAPRS